MPRVTVTLALAAGLVCALDSLRRRRARRGAPAIAIDGNKVAKEIRAEIKEEGGALERLRVASLVTHEAALRLSGEAGGAAAHECERWAALPPEARLLEVRRASLGGGLFGGGLIGGALGGGAAAPGGAPGGSAPGGGGASAPADEAEARRWREAAVEVRAAWCSLGELRSR